MRNKITVDDEECGAKRLFDLSEGTIFWAQNVSEWCIKIYSANSCIRYATLSSGDTYSKPPSNAKDLRVRLLRHTLHIEPCS